MTDNAGDDSRLKFRIKGKRSSEKHKYIASVDGKVIFSSDNEKEYLEMRQKHLASLKKKK